jgi:hypothetical protein
VWTRPIHPKPTTPMPISRSSTLSPRSKATPNRHHAA